MTTMAAIWDFQSYQFWFVLIYNLLQNFLSSFKSIDRSVKEKHFKIDFQDGSPGSHNGFPIGTI